MLSVSSEALTRRSPDMNATIVAVDLQRISSNSLLPMRIGVLQSANGFSRAKFLGFFVRLAPCQVVMEACGSAHFWARRIRSLGHTVAGCCRLIM